MTKILDLWCWEWNNEYGIYNDTNITTWVDIDSKNIDLCQNKFRNHTFILIDWITLPFEDESFDIIQSLDVLEHVDDLENVLNEATRVLKKWWKFVIEVPYWKTEEVLLAIKPEYWKQVHHVRKFADNELEKIMKSKWFQLSLMKKIKHFNYIWLKFYFKHADIINQKWEMNISPILRWRFILTYLPYFIFYKFFQDKFDNKMPKSVYFEFFKN